MKLEDLKNIFIQLKKYDNIIKKYYQKVKSESFGQNEWSKEGKEILTNIEKFEYLKNDL